MLTVERYEKVEDFIQMAGPYLIRQEAAHNLIFGVCTTLLTHPGYYEGFYLATARAGRRVVGAAMRTGSHALVLSEMATGDAVEALVTDAQAFYGTTPGIMGPSAIIEEAVAIWERLSGQRGQVAMRQRIYQLDQVIPAKNVRGFMRASEAADVDQLAVWMEAFQAEALGTHDPAQAALVVDLYRQGNGRGLYVWEVDGAMVSMTGYTGETPHGIRVNSVYTPPEQRGNGYASGLVAALSQHLLDSGYQFCFLFTDRDNPTSNKIYQRIGYREVCDTEEWRFVAG